MNSRKKLQKKETSAPVSKKYLEYEVSQGPVCCVRGRTLFLCESLGVSQGVPGQDKRRAESEKKEKEKCLFEFWFNSSPWFTNLISSFGGPLIILLLLLTLWPCLLNKLVAFIKSCIKAVQLMVRRSQYTALPTVPLAGDNIKLTPDP